MPTKNTFDYQLLPEVPAEKDQLPDGIHTNVAEQIKNTFEASDRGFTIGLEGKWGSGKSTVLNLLEKKLPSTENCIYIFDAWAHEGDPLRRIFLEGLIDSIKDDGSEKQLTNLKLEISGRKKTVEVKSKSRVSKLGRNLALSGLFLPLGASILSAIDFTKLVIPSQAENWTLSFNSSMFWLGLLICLSPLIVLLYWYIFGDKDEEEKKDWSVLTGTSNENYTQDITEDGERSTIEFEQYFKTIISNLFSSNQELKRLIIVLDNLDRVQHDTAKSVWSSLQPFFQNQQAHTREFEKVWFIIPHDRTALSAIWNKPNQAMSFIEKSIQLNIDVPLPILSSWGKYLETISNEALTGWCNEAKESVISVYKRYYCNIDSVPTPRQLRQYVNKVGATGHLWRDAMSVEAICFFSLLKHDNDSLELQKKLITKEVFKNYSCIGSEDNILAELSGMLFGVHSSKGLEILLGEEVRKSVIHGDIDKAKKIVLAHPKSIETIVHSQFQNLFPDNSHTEGYKINFTMVMLEILPSAPIVFDREMRKVFDLWLSDAINWELNKVDTDYSLVINKLHSIDPNWHGYERIFEKVLLPATKKALNTLGSDKANMDEIKSLYKLYINNLRPIIPEATRIMHEALDKDKWSEYVNLYTKKEISFDFILPPKNTINEIISSFNATSITREICTLILKSIELIGNTSYWNNLSNLFTGWAKLTNRTIGIDPVFNIWIWLYKTKRMPENYKELISSREFLHSANRERIDNLPCAAVFYALVFGHDLNDSPTPVKSFWENTKDKKTLESVSKVVDDHDLEESIWELSRNEKNRTAIKLIENNLENPKYLEVEAPSKYIHEFSWLKEDGATNLAKALIASKSFQLIQTRIFKYPYSYRHVLRIFAKTKMEIVTSTIDKAISEASEENWLSDLRTEDLTLVKLVDGNFPIAFRDAFESAMKSLMEGESKYQPMLKNIPDMVERIPSLETLTPMISEIYFNKSEDQISEQNFKILSRLFEVPEGESFDLKISNRIERWLKDGEFYKLEWICENLSRSLTPNEAIIGRLKESPSDELSNRTNLIDKLLDIFNLPNRLLETE